MYGHIYCWIIGCFFMMVAQMGCSMADEPPGEASGRHENASLGEPGKAHAVDGTEQDRGGGAPGDVGSKSDAVDYRTRPSDPLLRRSGGAEVSLPIAECAGAGDCRRLAHAAGWCNPHGRCEYSCEPGFGDANQERATDGCECRQQNAGIEVCDGVDDDCDGVVDNIFAGGHLSATADLTCVTSRAGALQCVGAGPAAGAWPATSAHLGQVSAGWAHGCALGADEAVYCWGDNRDGQAVPGGPEHLDAPERVELGVRIVEVSSGAHHTCAIARGGAVYCWGRNDLAQLGDGSRRRRDGPVEIAASLDFVNISAGANHTCAATRDGQALCWGANAAGQSGYADAVPLNVPTELDIPIEVARVSAGKEHTCALTVEGWVYCWGANQYGQLGDGTTISRAKPKTVGQEFKLVTLSAGGTRTCGVGRNSRVYCWGANPGGNLGAGDLEPVHVWPDGVVRSMDFAFVSAGDSHACGFNLAGRVFCWGDGTAGQLGAGNPTSSRQPRRLDCS